MKREVSLKRIESSQLKSFIARAHSAFSYYSWRSKYPTTISKWGFDEDGEFYIVSHEAKDYLKIVVTIELKRDLKDMLSTLLRMVPNMKAEELKRLLDSLNLLYLEALNSKTPAPNMDGGNNGVENDGNANSEPE